MRIEKNMKNTMISKKSAALVLLAMGMTALSACNKEDDVSPKPALTVASCGTMKIGSGYNINPKVFDKCLYEHPTDHKLDTFVVYFTYQSNEAFSVDIPVGPRNFVTFSDKDTNASSVGTIDGQITHFIPGKRQEIFTAVSNTQNNIKWTVDGNEISASMPAGWKNSAFCSGNPLPVELTSFTAKQTGASVVLNWRTASEHNNAGFQIEEMKPCDSTFTAVKNVSSKAAGGNSSHVNAYNTSVPVQNFGKHYYRLLQTDFDGTKSYSSIVVVDIK
jgi:hypothetical protein